MAEDLRIAVVGAAGRMGRMLLRAAHETPGCRLVAALERAGAEALGSDAGLLAGLPALDLPVTADLAALDGADAVLDFTTPAATLLFAQSAAVRGLVHVVGTTGLNTGQRDALALAADRARIVFSGNFSLGVNLLLGLVRQAAAALPEGFDIEVLEMHHRAKVDAPSGTALMLGEAAAAGRGISLDMRAVRGRDGHTGPRRAGDIGFASLRGGGVIGEHRVILAGESERIEIVHKAEDRGLFARGAVQAALWARGQPPGLYSMADVLGLG